MSSSDKENRYREADSQTDKRTCGARAKKEAVMTALEVALRMLRDTMKFGVPAKHVLFDSWFTHPAFVISIRDIGFHVIGRLKNSKTYYWLNGKALTIGQIYSQSKRRRGRSKYLLSAVVAVKNKDGKSIDARIVYVRDSANRKKWIAFLCTDMSLSEEQIIELYGKRWSIEVFFKTCKQYLRFTGEFQQSLYEAITAHTSIVSIRYMIFAIEQRQNVDYRRTPGDLFFIFTDEAKDIEFGEVISLLISELTKLIRGITRLDEKKVIKLIDKFFLSLPMHIQNLVARRNAA